MLLCVALVGGTLSPAARGEDAPKTGLAALVATVPDADKGGRTPGALTAPDLDTMKKIYNEVLKGGKENIVALVGMLVEPGQGDDYKARYVLHSMMTYVMRPDPEAEKDRTALTDALIATLSSDRPKSVKAMVLQELKWCGSKPQAEAIGKLLSDADLCEPAAQALVGIKDTADIFRQALPAAAGKNRVTVIQALGVLRDTKAVDELKKALADADPVTRVAACEALGNIGDPAAADAMLAAGDAAKDFDRTRMNDAVLLLAKRLIAVDNKKDAERIYAKLWETRTDPQERHVRIAALQGLASLRTDLNDLLAAMKTDDLQIRAVALRTAVTGLGPNGTKMLLDALEKAAPRDRADLLAILGARADPAAMPAILGMLKDPDEKVRIAAIQAAAVLGGEQAAQAVAAIAVAAAGKELEAAANGLARMPGAEVNGIAAAALKQAAEPAPRMALLSALGIRRAEDQREPVAAGLADKDVGVRIAALKALALMAGEAQLPAMVKILKESMDERAPSLLIAVPPATVKLLTDAKDEGERGAAESALVAVAPRSADKCAGLVIAALADAPPENAAALIRVLGAAGCKKALEAVIAQTKGANADLKDVAAHVLGDWRDRAGAASMLDLAQTSANETHQVLALRGLIRLAKEGGSPAEKVKLLDSVMKTAKQPAEKRSALGVLQDVPTLESLQLAVPCLDNDDIREEAAEAILKIADPLAKQKADNVLDAVRDALEKVTKATKRSNVRTAAQKLLNQVKK
ncbi:MAG: HEAT repeat domain-containing protein [Planctomycetota bacterium]|nr:HEAT repeat domain-containing protein [Planctomycetota bacterium]